MANSESAPEPVANPKTENGTDLKCPRCGAGYIKRMRRAGFAQKRIFAMFGYFPWRCTKCFGNFMLRQRDAAKRHQDTAADVAALVTPATRTEQA